MENIERLTRCECLVMKVLWSSEEELCLSEIVKKAEDRYHRGWKSQTVSTFLARLTRKSYLQNYRKGRVYMYKVLISVNEYRGKLTDNYVDFWFNNHADEAIAAIISHRGLRDDEIKRLKQCLSEPAYIT